MQASLDRFIPSRQSTQVRQEIFNSTPPENPYDAALVNILFSKPARRELLKDYHPETRTYDWSKNLVSVLDLPNYSRHPSSNSLALGNCDLMAIALADTVYLKKLSEREFVQVDLGLNQVTATHITTSRDAVVVGGVESSKPNSVVRIFDIERSNSSSKLIQLSDAPNVSSFDSTARKLCAAVDDTIFIQSFNSKRPGQTIKSDAQIYKVKMSANERFIAAGLKQGFAVWDVRKPSQPIFKRETRNWTRGVDFYPNSSSQVVFSTGVVNSALNRCDFQTGKDLASVNTEGRVWDLVITDDYIMTAENNKETLSSCLALRSISNLSLLDTVDCENSQPHSLGLTKQRDFLVLADGHGETLKSYEAPVFVKQNQPVERVSKLAWPVIR